MKFLPRLACSAFVLAAIAGAAETQQRTLVKESPFGGPAQASATAQANETLEFAGVSAVGKRTDLIFHDKATKKSHWVGIGETKEGISVVSYDSRREQAVVKVNGAEKVLTLRKSTGPIHSPAAVAPMPVGFNVPPAPAPAPAQVTPLPTAAELAQSKAPGASTAPAQPAAPAPAPGTPEAVAKQETEARMLVSDLLEIGMAQRKAYEEAQRKAAQGANAPQQQPGQQPTANAQPR